MQIFGFSSKSSENMIFWNFKSYSCTCIFLKGIHFQKRGCRGIRQKQLNFRCRSLVQLKVTWKLCFFWNVKSYSCIYLKRIHSKNMARKALDRNSWIQMQIICSVQSHVKIWFFEMSEAIPMFIWNEFTPEIWLQRH
jgi:hypothetical protein